MFENIDFPGANTFSELRAETSVLRVRYALSTVSTDSTRIMQRVAIRKILILRINVSHQVNLDLGLSLKVTLRGSLTNFFPLLPPPYIDPPLYSKKTDCK